MLQKAVFVGGGGGGEGPNIMNICSKPSCDIIIYFPDNTIFILLDCFTHLLQIQRLAKYDLLLDLSGVG